MGCIPYEIIVGVGSVYLAPVGTAFPDTDETPGASWTSLGSTNDDGVTVTHGRTLEKHYKGNSTLPQKMTLSEASEVIAFTLAEITVERYAMVLDNATVVTVAAGSGTPGTKYFPLTPSSSCAPQFALLLRGPSPLMDGNAQYEYTRVSPSGDVEIQYTKGVASGLSVTFEALEDTVVPGRFGNYRAQAAAAV